MNRIVHVKNVRIWIVIELEIILKHLHSAEVEGLISCLMFGSVCSISHDCISATDVASGEHGASV